VKELMYNTECMNKTQVLYSTGHLGMWRNLLITWSKIWKMENAFELIIYLNVRWFCSTLFCTYMFILLCLHILCV